ncbi:hypothetical protein BY458DRAFT_497209 [Sporodiniella umbellata]|nr:hypothetical protein BY458DRAFT_497209 [Sporodiniella umbellata]
MSVYPFDYEFYLNKPMKPALDHDVCSSSEESDSTSHSTQSRLLKKRDYTHQDLLVNDPRQPRKTKPTEKKQKNLYKTELCRNWEETNQCRYGTKCQYAHGAQDLREIERHPKYKTQKCRTFDKSGACPYGARCTFRHFSLPGDTPTIDDDDDLDDLDDREDDYYNDDLLPAKAESLLPHQLLFDINALDDHHLSQQQLLPPTFYNPPLCKSFFRPWLF